MRFIINKQGYNGPYLKNPHYLQPRFLCKYTLCPIYKAQYTYIEIERKT